MSKDDSHEWLVTPIIKWSLDKLGVNGLEITKYGKSRGYDNVAKDRTAYKILRVFYKFLDRHNIELNKTTIYAYRYNYKSKGQECKTISLKKYKEIKDAYIKSLNNKYAKKDKMEQSIASGKHFIACFDYFFNNVDLYRAERDYYRSELKSLALKLCEPAKDNDKIFIPVRILSLGWRHSFLEYTYRLLLKVASYINEPHLIRLKTSRIEKIKCFGNKANFTIGEYSNKFSLYSKSQLEALVRIHDILEDRSIYFIPKINTSKVKSKKDRKNQINFSIELLKDFLSNHNDKFYQDRGCEYKENMILKYVI